MSRISKFGLALMLFILVADLEAYLAPNVHNPELVFDVVIYLGIIYMST